MFAKQILYTSLMYGLLGCCDRLWGQSLRTCLARCLLPATVSSNFWLQWGHLIRFGGGRKNIFGCIVCSNIKFCVSVPNTMWFVIPRCISVISAISAFYDNLMLTLATTMKQNAFTYMMSWVQCVGENFLGLGQILEKIMIIEIDKSILRSYINFPYELIWEPHCSLRQSCVNQLQ